MNGKNGQSLIEVVFSIGLISVVISGIVVLLSNTIASRTKSYERVKTAELSQIVLENFLAEKNTNSERFWDINSSYWLANRGVALTYPGFVGYDYLVTVTPDGSNGCTPTTCLNITVGVGWSGSVDGSRKTFNRFFSRK